MSKKSLKRLGKEFKQTAEAASENNFSGSLKVEMKDDSLTTWSLIIGGPKEITLSSGTTKSSPYADRKFPVEIQFPADYPFVRPTVMFKGELNKDGKNTGKVPHNPHINEIGEVCEGLFGEWAPTKKVLSDIIPICFQVEHLYYHRY